MTQDFLLTVRCRIGAPKLWASAIPELVVTALIARITHQRDQAPNYDPGSEQDTGSLQRVALDGMPRIVNRVLGKFPSLLCFTKGGSKAVFHGVGDHRFDSGNLPKNLIDRGRLVQNLCHRFTSSPNHRHSFSQSADTTTA
jgi:hypothetical protein